MICAELRMLRIAQPIDKGTLQRVLLARASRSRRYIEGKIPAKLRSLLAPDDILQDVWIAAFRAKSTFRGNREEDLDRWLMTITNRKLVDAFRIALAVKRGGRTPIVGEAQARRSSIVVLFARIASPQATPSRVTSTKEAVDAVGAALAGLSDDRGSAVRMRHLEGLSVPEIAKRMQRTIPAVHSLLFNGLRDLRSRLGSAEKFFSDTATPSGSGSA
jgi:RNA polymerase sigma factor (sigma-70 family)